jgi:hypothetical protein
MYQRWDQVSIGGVSIPKNTDPWIYQRWNQVSRRSKHPYKHRPLDTPEVGSGALKK